MIEQRPGQKQFVDPGWGVRVIEPGPQVAAGGWWDDFGDAAIAACAWAAYQPKGAANLAASYVDLTGNGNNCGPGVAPTWDAVNGWKFNGATHWLDTSIVQNSYNWSILCQYTTYTSAAVAYMCGAAVGGAGRSGLSPRIGTNDLTYVNDGFISVNPFMAAGNTGFAGYVAYRNGAFDGNIPFVGNAPLAISTYIGARNLAGAANRFAAVYVQAFAMYNCVLTAPQVAAVAANMAAI